MERKAARATTKREAAIILALFTLAVTSPAFAQVGAQAAKPSADPIHRVVLVSIPDRKLAVIENGNVIATFPVAVGAASSPSPTGEFQIVNRVANPTYYRPGLVIPSGKRQSRGHALGRTEPEGLRHSRHERTAVGRTCGFARLHPVAQSRYREAVHDGARLATWFRFAASATNTSRRFSAVARTTRRWLRQTLRDRTAGNNSRRRFDAD